MQPTPLAGSRRLWAKLVGGGIVSLTIAIYFLAQVRIDRDDLVRGAIAVACLASLWCACRVVFPLSGGVRPWSRASFLLAALLLAAPGALLVHRAFGRESLITQQRRAVASAVNTLALTPTPFRNGMSDRPHYLSELGSELLRHVYRPAWERRPEPGLLLQLHRWAQLSDIGLPLVTEFDNTFAGFPTPAEIRRCRHMTGLSALHFWSLNDDPETRAALLELSRTHVVTGIIRDAFGVKLERVRFEGGQRVFESPEVAPVSGPHNEDLLDKSPVDKAPADEAPTPHPLQAPPQPQTDSLADIR